MLRRKLLAMMFLGAKMNENHDERGRFASGSGGSVEQANRDKFNVRRLRMRLDAYLSPIARTPIPKKDEESYQRSADKTRSAGDAALARMHGEAGSGGGGEKSRATANATSNKADIATDSAHVAERNASHLSSDQGHNEVRDLAIKARDAHIDAASAHRTASSAQLDTSTAERHSRRARYHDNEAASWQNEITSLVEESRFGKRIT